MWEAKRKQHVCQKETIWLAHKMCVHNNAIHETADIASLCSSHGFDFDAFRQVQARSNAEKHLENEGRLENDRALGKNDRVQEKTTALHPVV